MPYPLRNNRSYSRPIRKKCKSHNSTLLKLFSLKPSTLQALFYHAGVTPNSSIRALNATKLSIAKSLIKKGANINITDKYGNGILHYAIRDKNIILIKRLIEMGCNLNLEQKFSIGTPIYDAIESRQINIVILLEAHGADLTSKSSIFGGLPLHFAAIKNVDVLRYIAQKTIDSGTDIDIPNNYNETALEIAWSENNLANCKALLLLGADPNKINDTDSLIDDLASQCIKKEGYRILKLFVKYGWDIYNKTNDEGENILDALERDSRLFIYLNPEQNKWITKSIDFVKSKGITRTIHNNPIINDSQSTHNDSVENSIEQSALALKKSILDNFLNSKRQELFEFINALPSSETNDTAKRAIRWLQDTKYTDYVTNISLHELLAYVWIGANDPQQPASVEDRKKRVINTLGEIVRSYNLNIKGDDTGGKDSPSCLPGAFNALVSALSGGAHKDVHIVFVNNESIMAKAVPLTKNIISDIFKELSHEEQVLYARQWESPMPDSFQKAHLETIQSKLKASLLEEFSPFKSHVFNFDKLIRDILFTIPDMSIDTIESVKALQLTLAPPATLTPSYSLLSSQTKGTKQSNGTKIRIRKY